MNILVLAPDMPYPLNRGTHQRSFHLLKSMAKIHKVTFFCLHREDISDETRTLFSSFCKQVITHKVKLNDWRRLSQRLSDRLPDSMHHWCLPSVRVQIKTLLENKPYQLVYCQDIVMSQYLMEMDYKGLVITDRSRVDSEFQSEQWIRLKGIKRKILAAENLVKILCFERRLVKQLPCQMVCSEEDKRYLDRWIKPSVPPLVLENGVDMDYFYPIAMRAKSNPTLVFTGTMDYWPNADAMIWFKEKIFPLIQEKTQGVQLWIVGLNPPDRIKQWHNAQSIHVTGAVDDIRPYYAMADVFLCPIRIGGGTRLKLVEATAMFRPVVSTRVGAQGLKFKHKQHLRYADDAKQFANEVINVLDNPRQSHQMAQQAFDFTRENYSWSALARRLNSYLRTLSKTQDGLTLCN